MFGQILENYHRLAGKIYTLKDPRVDGYFLMESWWPSLLICLAYVAIIPVGKRIMKHVEPFNIRYIMVSYNVFMVFLSIYMVLEFLYCLTSLNVGLGCAPINYDVNPLTIRLVNVGWLFYISKYIEMIDTFFFILRKKNNLLTFLHIFHHASQPASLYFGIKFVAGGFGAVYPLINSTVHVFMYVYYALAAAGPNYQKYLWWKRQMTLIQMIQFSFLIIHNGQMFFIECDYPKFYAYLVFTYAIIFLVLFSNYFIKDIKRERWLKERARKEALNGNSHKSESQNGHKISNGIHKKKE